MNIFDTIKNAIPQSAVDVFVRTTDIASYMPEVQARLGTLAEIERVETNIETGSILITYEPERLRANAQLRRVEDYMRTHARRKAS